MSTASRLFLGGLLLVAGAATRLAVAAGRGGGSASPPRVGLTEQRRTPEGTERGVEHPPAEPHLPESDAPVAIGTASWDTPSSATEDLFRERDMGTEFIKLYGPMPGRPLAVPYPTWQSAPTIRPLWEGRAAARERLSSLARRTPNPLRGVPFHFLAYRLYGRLEVIVGANSGMQSIAPDTMRRVLINNSRFRSEALPDVLAKQLEAVLTDWSRAREKALRAWWSHVAPALEAKRAAGQAERDIVAVFVHPEGMVLVREGTSSRLESALEALEREERRLYMDIQAELKR